MRLLTNVRTTSITAAALAPLFATVAALSQSTLVPAVAQTRPILIEHAWVHTLEDGATVLPDGYVLFDGGLITAVGTGTPVVPEGCERIDATGKHVFPGFIGMGAGVGLVETLMVEATDDRSEFGEFHPEVFASIAVNPDSDLIPVARAAGVLTCVPFPLAGLVGGHASVLRMDGWTTEDLCISRNAGLVIHWPATEAAQESWTTTSVEEQRRKSAEDLLKIDQFFVAAQAWRTAASHDKSQGDLRYERMIEELEGTRPVFIEASSTGQIESAVLWALRRGLKPVIFGGGGAEACASLLVKHDIPVIIGGVLRVPRNAHDAYDSAYTLPARLKQAGVRFCIASGEEPAHERKLPEHAAMAVAFGLPSEDALAAITRDAARIAGVGDQLGTLAVGKRATLVVASGEPLEIRSRAEQAFIDGRRVELASHQSELESKYREKQRRLGQAKP